MPALQVPGIGRSTVRRTTLAVGLIALACGGATLAGNPNTAQELLTRHTLEALRRAVQAPVRPTAETMLPQNWSRQAIVERLDRVEQATAVEEIPATVPTMPAISEPVLISPPALERVTMPPADVSAPAVSPRVLHLPPAQIAPANPPAARKAVEPARPTPGLSTRRHVEKASPTRVNFAAAVAPIPENQSPQSPITLTKGVTEVKPPPVSAPVVLPSLLKVTKPATANPLRSLDQSRPDAAPSGNPLRR